MTLFQVWPPKRTLINDVALLPAAAQAIIRDTVDSFLRMNATKHKFFLAMCRRSRHRARSASIS